MNTELNIYSKYTGLYTFGYMIMRVLMDKSPRIMIFIAASALALYIVAKARIELNNLKNNE